MANMFQETQENFKWQWAMNTIVENLNQCALMKFIKVTISLFPPNTFGGYYCFSPVKSLSSRNLEISPLPT